MYTSSFSVKKEDVLQETSKKPPEEKSHHLLGSNTGRACVTQRRSKSTSLELVEIARGEDTIFCKYWRLLLRFDASIETVETQETGCFLSI